MSITLRLPPATHTVLNEMAHGDVESAGVLLAHSRTDGNRTILIAFELIPVPEDAYEVRTDRALQITSDGYVHALKIARARGAIAIWVHSHPGNHSIPTASHHDRRVNTELDPLFAHQTDTDQYGYLIVSHADDALTFTGEISGPVTGPIAQIASTGERWTFRTAYDHDTPMNYDLFDRNVRAFGHQIQHTISGLTVGIVGAGGTGSAVAEQLARLGVRSFILIDPDTLSASNTTRVYGSTPADVGRDKVDILGDHLEAIADGTRVTRIRGTVVSRRPAEALAFADIVFGCTDDNAGRLRLSRLPYYELVPVIDCGVQITADHADTISGIFGRVTTLCPGTACLMCRDRIDLALAEAEVRSLEEQQKLEKEGYAPALPGVEPAVVAFTTLVAATAVGELLERLVGYGEIPTPSELVLFIHDRAIRANIEPPRTGHYCDPASSRVGMDPEMYLGLNWAS
jgi:molybdopterin/thiamine biosynthesis adenylyltransferase/proteasome lid subunit RPN8/RPN11